MSYDGAISERCQSLKYVQDLRERMELEGKKGWDLNEDTFQGNIKELEKFRKLKADAIKILADIDDDLVKVKI